MNAVISCGFPRPTGSYEISNGIIPHGHLVHVVKGRRARRISLRVRRATAWNFGGTLLLHVASLGPTLNRHPLHFHGVAFLLKDMQTITVRYHGDDFSLFRAVSKDDFGMAFRLLRDADLG